MDRKGLLDTLGLAAVVASLGFVGFEIRQNTAAVESATLQGLAELQIETTIAAWSDDQMPGLILRLRTGALPEDFTPEEDQRVRLWYFTYIRLVENGYRQVGVGVLNDQLYSMFSSSAYKFPYLKAAWPSLVNSFQPEFATFFELEFLE